MLVYRASQQFGFDCKIKVLLSKAANFLVEDCTVSLREPVVLNPLKNNILCAIIQEVPQLIPVHDNNIFLGITQGLLCVIDF